MLAEYALLLPRHALLGGLARGLPVLPIAALHALATDSPEPTSSAAYTEALEVFNRRILPIMRSSDASSCAECHLSGVDLRDYILDTPERTFIALRDRDLVDLEHPMKSRILEFIRMSKPETERLTADVRAGMQNTHPTTYALTSRSNSGIR